MDLPTNQQVEDSFMRNPINRYLHLVSTQLFLGKQASEAWLFRDDIGAPHGIKGYEEQVNSVGMHHGHCHWPSEITWNTWNSAT